MTPLKSRMSNLVHNTFRKKDGSERYTYIKVTRRKGVFTYDINCCEDGIYTADDICKMMKFLIDSTFFSVWQMSAPSGYRNSIEDELWPVSWLSFLLLICE